MENKYNPSELVSVSDINAWLYCPRKVFLKKVLGFKEPLNLKMFLGKLKHSVIEEFSKVEETLVSQIDKNYDKTDLAIIYNNFLQELVNKVFLNNSKLVYSFNINKEEFLKLIKKDFTNDLKLRITEIKKQLEKGFIREELWKNLDSIYISEVSLESETLGLRGRVDRIEFFKKEGLIIPYEIKNRINEVYHGDELQLTAYAMLLEEFHHKKINFGFVEAGDNKKKIDFNEETKKEVLEIAEAIRNIKINKMPAMLSNFNKCKYCSFNKECPNIE